MRTKNIRIMLAAALLLCNGTIGYAQLRGNRLLGDEGLDVGTLQKPGFTVSIPYYLYFAQKLRDPNGNKVPGDFGTYAYMLGVQGNVVLRHKILGAQYGAMVLLPFMANRIEANVKQSTTYLGFSDIYARPVQFGWHLDRADLLIAYGVYMPTGRYQFGGENTGLGMWGHEISGGGTVHLNALKTISLSSVAYFEMHGPKEGIDATVGDILSIQGGLEISLPTGGRILPEVSLGPVWYMQFKTSEDRFPPNVNTIPRSNEQIYALGPEARLSMPLFNADISVRWLSEFAARSRFQGNTFMITIKRDIREFESSP